MEWSLENIHKQILPVNARVFLNTIFGDRSPITEKDFSAEELNTLKQSIQNRKDRNTAWENEIRQNLVRESDEISKRKLQNQLDSFETTRNRTSFGYGDYPVKSGEYGAPVLQSWPSAIYQSYIDPAYRLAATLGSAKYHDTGSGGYVEDTYGFDGRNPVYKKNADSSLADILSMYKNAPGSLGEILYSKYIGNVRRPVKINLP